MQKSILLVSRVIHRHRRHTRWRDPRATNYSATSDAANTKSAETTRPQDSIQSKLLPSRLNPEIEKVLQESRLTVFVLPS